MGHGWRQIVSFAVASWRQSAPRRIGCLGWSVVSFACVFEAPLAGIPNLRTRLRRALPFSSLTCISAGSALLKPACGPRESHKDPVRHHSLAPTSAEMPHQVGSLCRSPVNAARAVSARLCPHLG